MMTMDWYFEEVVQAENELVNQHRLFVLMMIYDENIHREYVGVTEQKIVQL